MESSPRFYIFYLGGMLAIMLLVTPLSARAAPGPDVRHAPSDAPIVVLSESESVSDWTVGNALLYWENDCVGNETPYGTFALKRRPLYGSTIRELERVDAYHCQTFQGLAADDSGVYYVDQVNSAIKRHTTDAPYTDHTIYTYATRPGTDLALDENYVYWGAYGYIYRAPKEGGSRETVAQADGQVTDIWPAGGVIYWLDKSGLWSASLSCGNLPCAKTHRIEMTFPEESAHTLLHRFHLSFIGLPYWDTYWVKRYNSTQREEIHHYSCSTLSCRDSVIYTSAAGWIISDMIWADGRLYWSERSIYEGRIRRMASGGQPETIAYPASPGDYLYADSHYIYFADLAQRSIYKLPFNASALYRDLALVKWEVTQGIQNTTNDAPLVAGKPTYVRVYGKMNSGSAASAVEAVLHGSRNHQPLPGTPLHPIANAQQYLQPGATIDRSNPRTGWLFRLPRSWTEEGDLDLWVEIDPRGAYEDNVPANDTLRGTFTFTEKAPVCIVWIPVRTHAPRPSMRNPNFSAMINLAQRLWPTSAYWARWYESEDIAELQVCWKGIFPYPCFGPYEIPEDTWKILLSLDTRDNLSDDPDVCDDLGATTHYVGMVHADTNTIDGDLVILGTAWLSYNDVAWVKFPSETEQPDPNHVWNFPEAGLTLAHELAHNKGRKHVACDVDEDIDHNYPYPTDQLDFTGPDRHYGFDVNTRTPIAPDGAMDVMSYCRPQWISDYTWKALFNKLHGAAMTPEGGAGAKVGMQPEAEVAGDLVYASGVITTTQHTGELNPAWKLPTGAMSQDMRRKWQRMLAPSFAEIAATNADNSTPYHLRLLDGDGYVLSDRAIYLPAGIDGTANAQAQGFSLTFAAPMGGTVRRLELLENNTVIAARNMGPNAPQITISKPQGGEIYYDKMTITWSGHDPDGDPLRYHVQYSPDNGASWKIIATDIPQPANTETITLNLDDLNDLPGLQQRGGRIRVLASDGYHTTAAVSPAFTLANRPPQAYIDAPLEGQSFTPGQPILFEGSAMDAEDGPLSGEALEWRLDNVFYTTGEEFHTAGIAPGRHQVQMEAADSLGQTGLTQASFEVLPVSIPHSDTTPTLDGSCEDAVYAQAVNLPLEPYSDGSQAVVSLVRSNDQLWACFNGLMRGASSSSSYVSLRIDVDHSRDDWTQSDDYGFYMTEDGTAFTRSGSGMGGFINPGPGGLVAQMATYGEDRWRVEMRIDQDMLNGWEHLIGLDVAHNNVRWGGDNHHWPYDANPRQPDTWATTALGDLPQLARLEPGSATAGDPSFDLTVHGAHFSEQDQILWQGVALPTTYVDTNTLRAQVASSRLRQAEVIDVTVRSAANDDFVSNALSFTILNPVPHLDVVSPNHVYALGSGFTLEVTGSDFMTGATVYWDDTPLPTTFIDSGKLQASVDSIHLQQPGAHGVTVINPSPGGGASNTMPVIVEPLNIFLPMMSAK